MRRPGLPVALGVRRCDSGTARAAAGSARAAGALVSGSSSLLHRFTSTRMASSARPLGTMHVPQSPDTTRSAVLVGLGNSVCLRVARPPCGAHTSHIRLVIGQVHNIRRIMNTTHTLPRPHQSSHRADLYREVRALSTRQYRTDSRTRLAGASPRPPARRALDAHGEARRARRG
eukprot:scaffold48_cov60-Phaeocystis_antarctica.AAC.2